MKADMARTYKPVSAGTLSARKAEKGAADMPRVGPPQLHIYNHMYIYIYLSYHQMTSDDACLASLPTVDTLDLHGPI